MPRGMTKQRELEIEARRKVVTANLLAGLNYRDMTVPLEVSLGTIANDVKVVIRRLRESQVTNYADIVAMEMRRLDTAINAIWSKVQEGNFQAITILMMLQNQRAKYLGLYDSDTIDRQQLVGGVPQQRIDDLDEVRRKRWEQIAPQLARLTQNDEIIDAEAQNVESDTTDTQ